MVVAGQAKYKTLDTIDASRDANRRGDHRAGRLLDTSAASLPSRPHDILILPALVHHGE